MAITVKKLELITTRDKAPALMEKMQRLGIAEVVSYVEVAAQDTVSAAFADTKRLASHLAELKRTRDFLSEFASKSGFISSLILSFLPSRRQLSLKEIGALIDDPDIGEAVRVCGDLRYNLSDIDKEEQEIKAKISALCPFAGIAISSDAQKLRFFNIIVGTVSRINQKSFTEAVRNEVPVSFWEWGSRVNGVEATFALIFPKEKKDVIRKLVERWEIAEQTIFWNEPVDIEVAKLKRQLEEALSRKKEIEGQASSLTSYIPQLEALIDWYSWELDKGRLLHEAGKTKIYIALTLWVPSPLIEVLRKVVSETAPVTSIRTLELEEGEQPPVVMQNKGMAKMFEVVTRIYGLPKFDEPDPTPFLAPFFIVFFALALSDTGYGAILLLISLGVLRFITDKGARLFFKLSAFGGALTMVAGIVAGTVFGTEVASGYRIIDPMGDPTGTLVVMFALGVIHLFVGLGIGAWWKSKQGDFRKALSKEFAAMILFIGASLALLTGITLFFTAGVIGMVLMPVIFSSELNIGKRLLGGLASLYSIVGYFSDMLSYSRLLALSLATGVIAMVINMIAFLFYEMIPVAGLNTLILVLVLVVGHMANFMISGLGAFVHSARLQFVEYFPKFIEGGGRELRPFSKQGKYVEIVDR